MLSLGHGQLPAYPFPGLVSASHLTGFWDRLLTGEAIFQDLSGHYFSSTSHCLCITAQLDELYSQLHSFTGCYTNCEWLGRVEMQPRPSLPNMWVLRGLETQHPATGTTTSRVNSFPPPTLLASGGREGLTKQVATLMAPLIGRDESVGFHFRIVHWAGARKQRQGEMHRYHPPCFTLHSLLSLRTPSCATQGQQCWWQEGSVPCGISMGTAKEHLQAPFVSACCSSRVAPPELSVQNSVI